MLVERDERAERLGRQLVGEQRVRGAVALEGLEGDEVLRVAVRAALLGGLAEGERLGLGEEVGHELVVVVGDGVVRLAEADEVAGDEVRALVDELVDGVLSVRAGLAPLDGAGGVRDGLAVLRDGLAVGLHVQLLQVGGQAAEVLVVGQDGVGLCVVAVRVEDAEEGKDDGQVAVELRRAEVLVHLPVALEKLSEVGGADGDHQREADGAREGVAAAHPVPETEHVGGVDAELRYLLGVRGDGDEVFGDDVVRVDARELVDEPRARGEGVRHGLLRGERL